MFLLGFPVAKIIYYNTIIITSCLEIIGVSHGTITLLLRDTELQIYDVNELEMELIVKNLQRFGVDVAVVDLKGIMT